MLEMALLPLLIVLVPILSGPGAFPNFSLSMVVAISYGLVGCITKLSRIGSLRKELAGISVLGRVLAKLGPLFTKWEFRILHISWGSVIVFPFPFFSFLTKTA